MVRRDVARATSIAVLVVVLSSYPGVTSSADTPPSEGSLEQEIPSDEVPGSPAIAGDDSTVLRVEPGSDDAVSLYDASTTVEVWRGSFPFETPIAYPHAMSLGGGTYAVAGVPCSRIERMEDSGPLCGPGGVSLATFDRDGRSWDVVQAAAFSGTEWVRVLGEHESSIVLQVGGSIVSVPLDGTPPVELSDPPIEGFTTVCMSGSSVAVVRGVYAPGDSSPEPGEWSSTEWRPFSPFESAVLDLDTDVWTTTGGPRATHNSPQSFTSGCADGSVLAVPRKRPREAAEVYATHKLNIESGTWNQADPPPEEFPLAGPALWTGQDFILFVTTDEANRVLTFGNDGQWDSTVAGQGGEVQSAALAGTRLVTLTREDREPLFSDLDGRFPEFEPPPLPSVETQSSDPSQDSVSVSGDTEALVTLAIRSHQWNMCGAFCNLGTTLPSLIMLESFNFSDPSLRPWSISLNEVCLLPSFQASVVIDHLLDLGYSVAFYTALQNAANCSGFSFGNLVFNIGPANDASMYTYIEQDPMSSEKRGVVCMENGSFLGDWVGCSTHMAPDDPIAAAQSDELFAVLAWTLGSTFRIVGGDFNIVPTYVDDPELPPTLQKWRGQYIEFDEASPYEPTLNNGTKIDYKWYLDLAVPILSISFGTEFWFSGGDPVSDHAYYHGLVSFDI